MIPRITHWNLVLTIGVSTMLLACAPRPVTHTIQEIEPPPPPTQVYFYPLHGQSAKQQDQDRYHCYLWAKQQTGFDPSAPQLAPHQRLQVVSDPAPGSDTAAGAIAGAVIGAMIAGPHDSAEGAIVGAMTGAMMGAAADTARQQEAEQLQSYYDQRTAQRNAHIEQKASNYRRAMTACLEGRGYSVR